MTSWFPYMCREVSATSKLQMLGRHTEDGSESRSIIIFMGLVDFSSIWEIWLLVWFDLKFGYFQIENFDYSSSITYTDSFSAII